MAVEHDCVYDITSVGNREIKDNNDGCNSIDEEGGGVLLTTMMATIRQLQKWATTIAATVKEVPTTEKFIIWEELV